MTSVMGEMLMWEHKVTWTDLVEHTKPAVVRDWTSTTDGPTPRTVLSYSKEWKEERHSLIGWSAILGQNSDEGWELVSVQEASRDGSGFASWVTGYRLFFKRPAS